VSLTRAGVLGWPVRHSRSPAMHEAAYAAVGLEDWRYQLLPVPPPLLAETVRALPAAGFAGANVTIPHKEAVLALADEASDPARAIGAANTLTFAQGAIQADNTDAPGLRAALDAADHPPRGAGGVVLGAGGSARAAVWALREGGAADVAIWNRTAERARALAAELDARAVDTVTGGAEILVNATPVGLRPDDDPFAALPLDAASLSEYACVVDLAYGASETRLVAAARAAGATVVDGLEVLVRQGALSFERFTGRQAPLEAMRAAARAA
jgi:shikimate dehydrogenase